MPGDEWIEGVHAAAKALGVSHETLSRWEKKEWWQAEFKQRRGRTARFNITAIKRANSRYANEDEHNRVQDASRKLSLQKRITEQRIADAKLAAIQRDQIPVEDVIAIVHRHNQILKNSLDQLPLVLARLADNEETENALLERGTNYVRQCLRAHKDDTERELQTLVNDGRK